MSDTTRAQLAYVKETEFGVVKTGSNLQIIRKLSEDLAMQAESYVSGELAVDRQTSGVRRVRMSTAGPVNYELSYGTYDEWMASALQDSAWSTQATIESAGTVTAVSSTKKFTTSGTWDVTPSVNSWLLVSGFTGNYIGNNGLWKVTAASTTEITVSGGSLTDGSDQTGITILQGAEIVNGTTLDWYNLERLYTDLTTELAIFLGQCINRWTLDMPLTGGITGAFEFIGKSEASAAATGGTGYTAASTTRPFTSLDVTSLLENAADMSVRSFGLTYDNQLHQRLIAGSSSVLSVGSGPIRVEGSIEAYYTDKTIIDKYINETASALALLLTGPDSNKYIFDFPRVAFTSANRSPSQSPDVLARLNWTAYKHPTELVTMRVVRFPVA